MNEISPRLPRPDSSGESNLGPVSNPEIDKARDLAVLRGSGLFDPIWYLENNPDLDGQAIDACEHFLLHGREQGRNPNPYFDTAWYLRHNPDVARMRVNPLVHYILRGEAEGRAPAAWFDLFWYRTRHTAPSGSTLLRHFLSRRLDGRTSPLPEFDPEYYLRCYPDVEAAGVDPFEHYLRWGFIEGRNPSANFDTRFYLQRYLGGEKGLNPLLHYRQFRGVLHLHATPPAHEISVFDEVRRFSRPGPGFEEVQPLPASAPRRACVLAYYLPQFHPVPENDQWWGRGFTEWTALGRAMPRFVGHYQPRAPRDLGHYRLTDPNVMRQQIALAHGAGLGGFVHYFYWFNGRRLLETPLEAMLADRSLDFPFCLMWANENWTRRWDGAEQEVLISQDYRADDDVALVDTLARHMRDPRYIRLETRPLLMVYRAGHIPDTAATLARWRALFCERHGENPIWVMAQSFGDTDPSPLGFDGAVEFPPHKLTARLPPCNGNLTWLDPKTNGRVYDYNEVARLSLAEPPPPYPLIKTAVPGWDNDPRRQGDGLVLHGATPAKYQSWLAALVERAAERPFHGTRLVCVNAWNEWAESAYLEPDVHYGGAWLNATARAISGLASLAGQSKGGTLLLVGHDAFPAGAQMLLLHLARQLRRANGVTLEILLSGGGALVTEYASVAPTTILEDADARNLHLRAAASRGIRAAIVNTCAAAESVAVLDRAGVPTTLLVHELPRLIAERGWQQAAREAAQHARRIVFAAECVRDGFVTVAAPDPARVLLRPQGCYRPAPFSAAARARGRAALDLPERAKLVLGIGYADLRKGFDLFLQAWRAARLRDDNVVFCWVGAIDPQLRSWLGAEIEAALATGFFRLPGFREDMPDLLAAADVLALTSREDPFPSVMLEALSSGLPVIAFDGGGGASAYLAARGARTVPMGDASALAEALLAACVPSPGRAARGARVAAEFAFDRYAADLLETAWPSRLRVSVVVPSYNYARFLPARLTSVFAQTIPVEEVIVLDDCSTDDSAAIASRVAAEWGRDIRLLVNDANSGSVFAQWRRGVELARGDWIWIAEADDEADPDLLATLADRLAAAPDAIMAFCDSRPVDESGALLGSDYKPYYVEAGAAALEHDGLFRAREFARAFLAERNLVLNASAALFRRTALQAALERCSDDLGRLRLAGDWRLYLELLAEAEGSVAYIAAPLNRHRRHASSVTGETGNLRHAREVAQLHELVRKRLDPSPALRARQDAFRERVAAGK